MKAARLNAEETDRQTGTSLLLKVMAGDKVEMNVNNFYENYDANEDGPLGWEGMMNSRKLYPGYYRQKLSGIYKE